MLSVDTLRTINYCRIEHSNNISVSPFESSVIAYNNFRSSYVYSVNYINCKAERLTKNAIAPDALEVLQERGDSGMYLASGKTLQALTKADNGLYCQKHLVDLSDHVSVMESVADALAVGLNNGEFLLIRRRGLKVLSKKVISEGRILSIGYIRKRKGFVVGTNLGELIFLSVTSKPPTKH